MINTAPDPTSDQIATTARARAHARDQEGTVVPDMPTVPASSTTSELPPGVGASDVVWTERIAGGGYGHRVLAAGTHIRLTDITGDACASLLLYHADMPWERLNVADTIKVQWQVYLSQDQLLLSDQGRVLVSIVKDTSNHHDTVYGASTQRRNVERYGDGSPEGASPAGRELLALAATKNGLGRRDVAPCVSFFQGVRIDPEGRPQWQGSAGAGAQVTLRCEMPVVVLLANAAHPLDPRSEYTVGSLDVLAWRGTPTTPVDDLWRYTPEGRRAFENTTDHLKGRN